MMGLFANTPMARLFCRRQKEPVVVETESRRREREAWLADLEQHRAEVAAVKAQMPIQYHRRAIDYALPHRDGTSFAARMLKWQREYEIQQLEKKIGHNKKMLLM